MAYGKWILTAEEEKYFVPLFKYMIDELTIGRRHWFDLSGKGINPSQAIKLMTKLGYPAAEVDANESLECYQYFKGTNIYLYYCGLTFELQLETK